MALLESTNKETIGSSWFAVQVKTTHEKRVASSFDSAGYEWFLPLYACRRLWSDRMKHVDLPLFPGYIFCRFTPCARVPILKTPSVLRIAGTGSAASPVDEQEITALQRVMKSGAGVSPFPFLQAGQRVRIDHGSFCGLEGLISDLRQHDRLILSVGLLQRSVAVEIDSAWVSLI